MINHDIETGLRPGDKVKCVIGTDSRAWEICGRFVSATSDGIRLSTGFVAIGRLICIERLEDKP